MFKKSKKSQKRSSESVKKSLIKARAVIRKKFRELHNQRQVFEHQINEEYKPIVDPLERLVGETKREKKNEIEEEKEIKEEFKSIGPSSVYKTAKKSSAKQLHFDTFTSDTPRHGGYAFIHSDESDDSHNSSHYEKAKSDDKQQKKNVNVDYGFRTVDGQLFLGNDPVTVKKNRASKLCYSVKKKTFPVTDGLSELLLRKNPTHYTARDLNTYKKMLVHTNAHKSEYKVRGAVKNDPSSAKYNKIIKELFPPQSESKKKSGSCLKKPQIQMDFKVVNKAESFNYTYWDDPNELVDRLRLLLSSQSAGHTNHNNEIISIIEELHEAKIIK